MDWNSLKDQVTKLSLYDVKAGVRKVQNAVMNYTEMEAKVREATNNEPWGASSTLMQDIANATFSYQLLNEVMPMIYKRFTEKAADEWRQIYKALQLLEFLIKNGSERVIDDTRSHLSLLKMLRQFQFIDQNGKDQGINVRNRSKELVELLSDVERIRAERKKARSMRNKYGGVEGGPGTMMTGSSSGGRYGGFGSETGYGGGGGGSSSGYGGYGGEVYGDGGGFGGNETRFSDTQRRRDRFEEYDEGEDMGAAAGKSKPASTVKRETAKVEPPKPKEPEVDLFSFDEPTSPAPASNGKAPAATNNNNAFASMQAAGDDDDDDDDFDDFQFATPSAPASSAAAAAFGLAAPPAGSTHTTTASTRFAAPQPKAGSQASSINHLFASMAPTPPLSSNPSTPMGAGSAFAPPSLSPAAASSTTQPIVKQTGYQPAGTNYFQSVPIAPSGSAASSPFGATAQQQQKPKASGGGDAFAGLLGASRKSTPKAAGAGAGVSMADMAKLKSSASLWGTPASSHDSSSAPASGAAAGQKPAAAGSAANDLLF